MVASSSAAEVVSGALGERIRALRKAAGMTQSELAGGRFSKEYVSQLERGKARPSQETLEWLAERLGTDPGFLQDGFSRSDVERVEQGLAEAEALLDRGLYEEAVEGFRSAAQMEAARAPAFALRVLTGEASARTRLGQIEAAVALLEEAASLVDDPRFSELDRAEVMYRVGVCRYSRSDNAAAIGLFDEALSLAERSGVPCDALRSDIFQWRSRAHRRDRDWVAAQEDAERALELAVGLSDTRRAADAYFQSSLNAQRQGRWVLARTHAEQAKALFEELGDRATVGRLLNNLAGLAHLLGDADEAVALLRQAFEIFVDLGLAAEAGYVCASLADIHLDGNDFVSAEDQARKALSLLGGRVDHLQEVGTAQLALGRALLAQGRLSEAEGLIVSAGDTFDRADSVSHRSDAWVALGDVEAFRGDDREAGRLYRRAALALLEPTF
jgi:tetratricopeptide (TPR) repeat protein